MQLQYMLTSGSGGIDLSGPWLFVAIALLACLLGALVAGIGILISKISRANGEKRKAEDQMAREESRSHHWGFSAVMMLGAVPAGAYIALAVVACCVAVAALAFVVLVVYYRIKGYMFLSAKDAAALSKAESEVADTEEQYRTPVYHETEEQKQEAYTPVYAEEPAADGEESPFDVFSSASAEGEEIAERQEVVDETASGELLPAVREGAVAAGQPTAGDGTGPYKIVEKTVIETQKEIVREVPSEGGKNGASDALMEKLTDFLDYELQRRKDADAAVLGIDVPAFAKTEDPEDMDEDEDEDEDDVDENDPADEENDIDDEEPDSEDRFTGNERIIGFDEETGCYIVAHYRKSFEAKLIQARPRIKQYYSEIKNALLAYNGNKSRISWAMDSINNGRTQIAKINVKTNILELYLALEPDTLEDSPYKGKNVGHKKKYADTPFLYKIKSSRRFKWAMELVVRTCEEQGLFPIDIEPVNYEEQYPFESTESLVARKLIKEYIREEKPATTFELAPDHVTQVPDEDPSVIPANANFSWEFDNEEMEAKAEEYAQEPIVEEPVEEIAEDPIEEAPAEEPAAPASTVVRETVKVTEMRYTERYYADAAPSFEQVITTTEETSEEPLLADGDADDSLAESTEEIEEETNESVDLEEDSAPEEDEDEEEDTSENESFEDENVLDGVFGTESPAEEAEEAVIEDAAADEEDEGEYYFDRTSEEVPAEAYSEEYTSDESYADEPYADESYADESYAEEAYTEEAYTDEQYADGEDAYYQEQYAEYTEEEYSKEEYAEEEYYEEETPHVPVDPGVAVIDICVAAEAFSEGDTVNLETLQEKGLVLSTATTLKIYATGALDKALSVEANHFTLDAIFAISEADGDTSMIY